MEERSSNYKQKDFAIGERVLIINSDGARGDFTRGKFRVGDVGIVSDYYDEKGLIVKVERNGSYIRMYSHRFDKLSPFKIGDTVNTPKGKGRVMNVTNEITVLTDTQLLNFKPTELELISRQNIL